MVKNLVQLCAITAFAPLVGSMIAGLFRNYIGKVGAHTVTILGVALSLSSALLIAYAILFQGHDAVTSVLYQFASGSTVFPYHFNIGFLIDPLSAIMMVVVTFVSLLVHVYSIGYMAEDDGYQRFFSYISLFTFAMLMLVTSNNFLQLFFGWEGVGLVSYLLIGFWWKRESAIAGSLKAFLVNRVGDFGFLLGIALIYAYTGSIDYATVFPQATVIASQSISLFSGVSWSLMSVICICLFVGAMGKSAQVPLHIWLPESMEGPTPISALIHAATMVTAGVFLVARMSPLFEYSETALNFVLVIGATGALFTGLIALVMNDIKRVVAYSTLSQLGYMMVAMGASAYNVGIFHLATHACFKALLFLGAGSVIMAMHHEQDMRKMGGLYKYMPITYITFLIGNLALAALPPFAGFYSKDMIIDAAHNSHLPGAGYAYYCVLLGAFVTGFYSFRSFFMTFHMEPRMDEHTRSHLHESPWVVWLPLVILAVPSVVLGYVGIDAMLFAKPSLLGSSIFVLPAHDVMAEIAEHYHGPFAMAIDALSSPAFWLALGGIISAWICYEMMPWLPAFFASRFSVVYSLLEHKYWIDDLNENVVVRGTRSLGQFLFGVGDKRVIDGLMVNGTGFSVRWVALRARLVQSGYLNHYAIAMVIGLIVFFVWFYSWIQ